MGSFAGERYAMLNRGSSWVPGNDGGRAAELDFSEMTRPDELSAKQLKEMLVAAHQLLKKDGETT
jgi:hypothetical protein